MSVGFGFINLEDPGVSLTPRTKSFVKDPKKPEIFASPDLVIDKDQLENGVQYKFRLSAGHADSSSYADISILTNAAPSQGGFVICTLF